MADFRWFMSLVTGKTGKYPAHYASDPDFVEVDPDDAPCTDCLHGTVEDDDEAILAAMYDDDLNNYETEDE